MQQSSPIVTTHLFPVLDQKLIDLLKSLSAEDWNKPTIAKLWTVKDIAAHLLDTNVRAIAARDNYDMTANTTINSYSDLVGYLNELNAIWVNAMKRASPGLLIDMLESTGKQYSADMATLDPGAKARYPVSWAGESESYNWFDVAREYTEKWHHQQQIRLAVGKTDELFSPELYTPYLETSMRALPHHYRTIKAKNGNVISFTIKGYGEWFLHYNEDKWNLTTQVIAQPICEVDIDPAVAWRIFTKGIAQIEAKKHILITGDTRLGEHILSMLAVMA
jgi:uncharacterized protein (TIGR03083 family)